MNLSHCWRRLRRRQRQSPIARRTWPQPRTGLAVQVALDRAGFSSGVIDGRIGANTKRALDAYRSHAWERPDARRPNRSAAIEITTEDTAGPFAETHPEGSDGAVRSCRRSSYRSVVETLAERFHTTPEVLKALNSAAQRSWLDETIQVPNVEPLVTADDAGDERRARTRPNRERREPVDSRARTQARRGRPRDVVVSRVSETSSSVTRHGTLMGDRVLCPGHDRQRASTRCRSASGRSTASSTTRRSATTRSCSGTPIRRTPRRRSRRAERTRGLVWIDISKEHYGLHGSPEPSQIGRTESHGCVRLTNWDAVRVARLVEAGHEVLFTE